MASFAKGQTSFKTQLSHSTEFCSQLAEDNELSSLSLVQLRTISEVVIRKVALWCSKEEDLPNGDNGDKTRFDSTIAADSFGPPGESYSTASWYCLADDV